MPGFTPNPHHMAEKPRRVRGGVRSIAKQFPPALSWAGTRWLDVITRCAREHDLRDGFEYARAGQTRSLDVEPGRIIASVQGRAVRPYKVVVQVETFTDEAWDAAVASLSAQALFSGKVLAGEMTEDVVEHLASIGMTLFPRGPADVIAACTAPNETPWCKHACCTAILVAEAIDRDPMLLLQLRGMPAAELIERLRDHRTGVTGASAVSTPTSGATLVEEPSPPLESVLDEFWDAGPGLAEVETPLRAPEVSHPLLRRLGPSPFTDGRFPLVGLLATCYDTLSAAALQPRAPQPADDPGAPPSPEA